MDKMWAAFGTTPMSHHMNWAHVRGEDGWKYEWPIKLSTRKVDLKDYAQINQMAVHLFSRWNGPFIVLGIHLCGTLHQGGGDVQSVFERQAFNLETVLFARFFVDVQD